MANSKPLGEARTTGLSGEDIVMRILEKEGLKPQKAGYKEGYDIKAGKRLIEVKSTRQTNKQKNFFGLSENEFLCLCKNKNYWLYWVNVDTKEIVKKIPRDKLLKYVKPYHQYAIYLSQIKKIKD